MYMIIVGAGSIGSSLMYLALQEGHEVAMIDRDETRAHAAAQKFDALVLHADIAQGGILEEADIDKADAVIATTSDDATNLMVMFLGREHEIKKLVSLVNVKEHLKMFKSLGVQTIVDPEKIVAQHLYGRLHNTKVDGVTTLTNGEQISEVTVSEESRLVGNTIQQSIDKGLLSRSYVFMSLRRNQETAIMPAEDMTLQAGDHLIIFSQQALSETECAAFTE